MGDLEIGKAVVNDHRVLRLHARPAAGMKKQNGVRLAAPRPHHMHIVGRHGKLERVPHAERPQNPIRVCPGAVCQHRLLSGQAPDEFTEPTRMRRTRHRLLDIEIVRGSEELLRCNRVMHRQAEKRRAIPLPVPVLKPCGLLFRHAKTLPDETLHSRVNGFKHAVRCVVHRVVHVKEPEFWRSERRGEIVLLRRMHFWQ